jgi:hypothetical protein
MFLPRIQEKKDADFEEEVAEKWFHELPQSKLPPCVGEKVTFMSPHDVHRLTSHPYSSNKNNDKFYGHYQETSLRYPAFSFSVIPYNWMQKDGESGFSELADQYGLAYDPKREPNLGFRNTWIQEIDNQRALLNKFIEPVRPHQSLIFPYAKNIPNIENSSRILLGAGMVTGIGELTEYTYEPSTKNKFRSTLWERPVYHSIRPEAKAGFLLPYQDLFKAAANDDSIDIMDYIAFAPSFEEFSYGSEWVNNDSGIESLLILNEKLKKFKELFTDRDFSNQFKWIDGQLSSMWKMRGPFPGLGAVLSGLKISGGNFLAWNLDKLIRDPQTEEVIKNPWELVNRIFNGDQSFLAKDEQVPVSNTLIQTWKSYSPEEKEFLELLSRMSVNNAQVQLVIGSSERDQIKYLDNPFLLYEHFRLELTGFSVGLIDKGVSKTERNFPLKPRSAVTDPLDERRIRAIAVRILEEEAEENGNTLLTGGQLVTKMDEQPLEPLCNPSTRNLVAISEFLQTEIVYFTLDLESDLYYFKLKRYDLVKEKIQKFVQKRSRAKITLPDTPDWLNEINTHLNPVDADKPEWYRKRDNEARAEKAAALEVMSLNRISALIGPAGTGKTTLIDAFCNQPFIRTGRVLKLAPTGKARVKMGKDGQTLAQFLIRTERYDPETGRYFINPEAKQEQYDTVIIDECSMLTEDQVAALIDSLAGVTRFILLGDFRQLPPIGAGRPFADIVNYLKKEKLGLSELKVLFRHLSGNIIPETEPDRIDVRLAKWFSDDEIKKQDDDIFQEIAVDPEKRWPEISFVEWYNVRDLESKLIEVTNKEIELVLKKQGKPLRNERANFDAALGATVYFDNSNWSGFDIASAGEIEKWQILSPGKTAGYGTKVLNKELQKHYRGDTVSKAIKTPKYKSKMPKPLGDDGIVFGDKLINVRNTKWNKPYHKLYNPNNVPDSDLLKYIANGEIGLHVGPYKDWNYDSPRPINFVFSSQKQYAYIFKDRDFREDGDLQMELAYAVTVHKSQGSGFGTVIFILPNPCPILSRELFYTALTRQEDRIVILHHGNFKDYQKFTMGNYSETARRLTDLFVQPELKFIKQKYYDNQYIQVSAREEFMISKSEVIIADLLHHYHVNYVYEGEISDDRGIAIHPDFIFEDSDSGTTYYWEHLGLLGKDDYRSKWVRKQEWYARNGIVERDKDPFAPKQLIITRDKPDGGIDASEIKKIIEDILN